MSILNDIMSILWKILNILTELIGWMIALGCIGLYLIIKLNPTCTIDSENNDFGDEWCEQLYKEAINRLAHAIETSMPLEEFEDEYEWAISLADNVVDAYCKKAEYLYVLYGAEVAGQYMDSIIDIPLKGQEDCLAELYFTYAKCKLYKRDFETARKYCNMAAEKGMREACLAEVLSEIDSNEIY